MLFIYLVPSVIGSAESLSPTGATRFGSRRVRLSYTIIPNMRTFYHSSPDFFVCL